jgi:hypothetical protein
MPCTTSTRASSRSPIRHLPADARDGAVEQGLDQRGAVGEVAVQGGAADAGARDDQVERRGDAALGRRRRRRHRGSWSRRRAASDRHVDWAWIIFGQKCPHGKPSAGFRYEAAVVGQQGVKPRKKNGGLAAPEGETIDPSGDQKNARIPNATPRPGSGE